MNEQAEQQQAEQQQADPETTQAAHTGIHPDDLKSDDGQAEADIQETR